MDNPMPAILLNLCAAIIGLVFVSSASLAQTPAKNLFGAKRLPAVLKPQAHGFYSKGCVSGAVAIPTDGPTWQAMRLSRNRRWGHPDLIKLVINLSQEANKVGWNGLLVGDISQPRGGPMLTGHASHQIGLDADIWLTEMPKRTLSNKERETLSATSMLRRTKKGRIDQSRISKKTFGKGQFNLIRTAAKFDQVERVLVHPTIKRELCRMEKGADRKWLYKVRPYWGHHYHMHVRMECPADSPNCRPQAKPKADDGCGEELDYWAKLINPPKRKKKKVTATKPKPKKKKVVKKKRKKKRQIQLADLPLACRAVLTASGPASESAVTAQLISGLAVVPKASPVSADDGVQGGLKNLRRIPTPSPRPKS